MTYHMSLRGEGSWSPPTRDREPIEIHPDVRIALRNLLYEDDMRGVGYSEFIKRAVDAAHAERQAALQGEVVSDG